MNHSFVKIKAAYNFVSHPRFGWIRSVVAIDDIYKGEEIFINYHYPIQPNANVPQWFKDLYEEQVGAWPKNKDGGIKKTF